MTLIIFPNFDQLFFLILLKSSNQFYSVKFSGFLCDNLESRVFFDRESHSVFPDSHHFLCYENFVNYENSFLNRKNSNTRIDSTDAKSPKDQIVTKNSYSHTYSNSHTFFWPYENVTIWRLYSYL